MNVTAEIPDATKITVPNLAGLLALMVGGVVLTGWALDIAVLKSVVPGGLAVKANTALALILTGIALGYERTGQRLSVRSSANSVRCSQD